MWYTKLMKKNVGFYLISFLVVLAIFTLCLPNAFSPVFADSSTDPIYYVSLGDSIAEGYGLSGYVSKTETSLVAESYPYLFNNNLKDKYSNINAISYAKSGDATADLITKLQDETIVASLKKADIITICIGANDILGPAQNGMVDFVLNDADITADLDAGLESFSTNFPTIIQLLNEINKDAKKVFTNVYNPYKEFLTASHNITISAGSLIKLTVSQQKLVEIGALTETYVAGNKIANLQDGTIKRVYGLNERMAGILQGKDVTTDTDLTIDTTNCYLVDSKQVFDTYSGTERLVNADILDYETINTTFNDMQADLMAKIDPHPTALGHSLMAGAFNSQFEDKFVFVNYDYDGGTLDGLSNNITIVEKGTVATEPTVFPTKTGCKYKGWYYNDGTNDVDYAFTTVVNSNLTIKAKWKVACTITFNTVGGQSIDSQYLEEGEKVAVPQTPVKAGSTDVFAGWYYISGDQLIFWNFDTDVVTGNLTLNAKWVNSICSDTTLLIQEINNLKPINFTIDIDANIQWYVNNTLQQGENGKTFRFVPPENAGEFRIYCVVDGKETKKHTVVINYMVPQTLTAEITTITDKNLYSFSIENGKYIDGSKCIWYATVDQFSDEVEQIGEGTTCTVRISNACKVYAVYNSDEIFSNYIEVDPPFVIGTNVYIIIGVTLLIGAFVVILTIVSRKRYKDYY